MWSRHVVRPSLSPANGWLGGQFSFVPSQRFLRHQAFDASFDQDELAEARKWHESFRINSLPLGSTSFSRSSGPGGQHVNKTETKATTTWPVPQLLSFLPKLLHAGVRESKYYSKRSDCITIQAQTQRSRAANADENRQKLFEELRRLYGRTVPGAPSPDKAKKYEALKRSANEARINFKKQQSAKKSSRKGSFD
ncbi:Putative translation release factor [Madurella fahalii]|uniref:Translation release factor n=1 Tax=Madurella fahalii TaxID=1157608 RepID=A0ABQ0GIK1_9PEZI